MNHVNAKLSTELKKSGFPQPEPQPGQFWYNGPNPSICCAINHEVEVILHTIGSIEPSYKSIKTFLEFSIFAPAFEDIAPLLPECVFEVWGEKPSCTNQNDEIPIRTFGATFAEAAAKMWLILYT